MSYLTLLKGIPNFSKAVISLWFRVPKDSVVAASKNSIDAGNGYFMMQSVLPIITFGRQQTGKIYRTPKRNVAVIHPYLPFEPDPSTTYYTDFYEEGPSYKVDPTYIGVLCYEDGSFKLAFNLQMADYMVIHSGAFITTKMDIWSGSDPEAPQTASVLGSGVVSLFPNVGQATIQDVSYVNQSQPEYFYILPEGFYDPDRWHHLLLSFDISGSVSIGTPFASSTCRLWYAIDDVDYRGAENMQPYRNTAGQWGHDNLDPNAILNYTAWRHSGLDPNWEAINYYQNHFVGLPWGSYVGGSIPSSDAKIGIPASTDYVDSIFRVEMAELQIWTDATLDTGIESNRRAFVDEHGQPVNPTKGGEKLLGKKPDILLHGSVNWKMGYNTGTTGTSESEETGEIVKIPDGQFQPTGGIESYKPDPKLENHMV